MAVTELDLTKDQRVVEEAFAKLASAVDSFEEYALPHASRLATLAEAVARLYHFASKDLFSLRVAALAHDLGEFAMKREYIKRIGTLSEDERLDLIRHTIIGEQEAARAGADRGAQLMVRWHHEWWNGGGYPDGLSGEQIPLPARILRVADTYAALTAHRPYRAARTEQEARQTLADWAGIEFDPRVVRAFLSLENLDALRLSVVAPKPSITLGEVNAAPGENPR
jgi:HD-GYP domain-containing protein (c-di-GMP phosphodiesterase class II)